MSYVQFLYEGETINVQCSESDPMDFIINKFAQKVNADLNNITFKYNGGIVDINKVFKETLNIIDIERNTMAILAEKTKDDEEIIEKTFMKANRVVCPECYEDAKIEIKDYKIKIYGCKNDHVNYKILFKEFDETQTMDETKIICEKCKENNKSELFEHTMNMCNNCKINLCPICADMHDKEHKIIKYEEKNYFCDKHNETYEAFCSNCEKDLCLQCLSEHNNHNIVNYDKKVMREEILKDDLNDLRIKLEKFKESILDIINKLNKVMLNMDMFYKLNESMINDFSKEKKNYKKFLNINEMFNKNIIKDVDTVINDNDFNNKFKVLINMSKSIRNK